MTIIGIAGGTGSGKTTVVKRIAKALPPHCAAVVPLDSYYNDTTGLTPEERAAINFDHPDAFDWKLLTEHIKRLKNGEAIEQPTYSYIESNRQKETVHVEPKPVIRDAFHRWLHCEEQPRRAGALRHRPHESA